MTPSKTIQSRGLVPNHRICRTDLLPLPSAGEGRGEGVPPQAAQHLNAET